jgi:hypothetical protein
LSRCWGIVSASLEAQKTTSTSNFAQCKKPIVITDLPQTCQDGINITQKLGESYLWIDFLCIIQDSKQDWALESAHIWEIYANAVCTLSAASAASPEDGLFTPRADLDTYFEFPENVPRPKLYPVGNPCDVALTKNNKLYSRAWHSRKDIFRSALYILQHMRYFGNA